MVRMDVEADLEEVRKPLSPSPITASQIEELLTTSELLKSQGIRFESQGDRIWRFSYQDRNHSVPFYPDTFDETSSLRLMTVGDPIFETLTKIGYSFEPQRSP
jgi:hypothetical protein